MNSQTISSQKSDRNVLCERLSGHRDFVHLQAIGPLVIDLRYAGDDNFVGKNLYGELDCAWLHREAACALQLAAVRLSHAHSGYRLVVLDALRPHRIQKMLWQHLDGTPLQMYVADPVRSSIHSFGMAVDVTVMDADDQLLDMGSAFDEFDERSHPSLELMMLSDGRLSQQHVAHRQILRDAMFAAGFSGIHSEWWHFNLGDPEVVRKAYLRVD